MPLNKAQIRQILIEKRRALSADASRAASECAAKLFVQHAFFKESERIACYFGQKDEINCSFIIDEIWRTQKSCYLPVLFQNHLEFKRYEINSSLKLNKYNILEPDETETLLASELDVVLVPLVGFDLNGNRVGRGGGYYDRTFEFLQNSAVKKPYLIGFAYECQRVDELPSDPWDVPLNAVLTEEKIYFF